ncbi:hypothetical protein V2G26_013170 [Clonostachys chloroleuca]
MKPSSPYHLSLHSTCISSPSTSGPMETTLPSKVMITRTATRSSQASVSSFFTANKFTTAGNGVHCRGGGGRTENPDQAEIDDAHWDERLTCPFCTASFEKSLPL